MTIEAVSFAVGMALGMFIATVITTIAHIVDTEYNVKRMKEELFEDFGELVFKRSLNDRTLKDTIKLPDKKGE